MKKTMSIILAILMVITIFPITKITSYAYLDDCYTYTLDEANKTITLTKYIG